MNRPENSPTTPIPAACAAAPDACAAGDIFIEYYSEFFEPEEYTRLPAQAQPNLVGEIKLMRLFMRRVLRDASQSDSLEQLIKALNALGSAASKVATLCRAQQQMQGGAQDEFAQALAQALSELAKELDLERIVSGKGETP